MYRISLKTKAKVDFQDITHEIQELITRSGVENGTCLIFVPHTTAGITINEHADPSVVEDIATQLNTMVPQHAKYRHLEGNAPAHIKAGLMGSSQTVLIERGELFLGTWQGVFFCEFDGPRNRGVIVKIMRDKSNDITANKD
ncbi:secondary thiamine-phosphate synthase enzyme YjbQ [Chloroflexota bacterium]